MPAIRTVKNSTSTTNYKYTSCTIPPNFQNFYYLPVATGMQTPPEDYNDIDITPPSSQPDPYSPRYNRYMSNYNQPSSSSSSSRDMSASYRHGQQLDDSAAQLVVESEQSQAAEQPVEEDEVLKGFEGDRDIVAGTVNGKVIDAEYLRNDIGITDYQRRVYLLLLTIPAGSVTTYAHLSTSLSSSPRAIGNALRRNPYAPIVPCHRVIASNGYIGGFLGDWRDAPSGINMEKKMELLKGEGVEFDARGYLRKGRVMKNL